MAKSTLLSAPDDVIYFPVYSFEPVLITRWASRA